MTLENTAPSLELPDDNFITSSLSPETKFMTLPHSTKISESVLNYKQIKNGTKQPSLSRTASESTFMARYPGRLLSSPASSTADNTDFCKDKKSSFKKRHESGGSINLLRNQHPKLVRNFSAKELSSLDPKKNHLLSRAHFSDRGSMSSLGQSSISHRAVCSGEVLLDFPGSSNRSSVSSINKKSDKNKNLKSYRARQTIHHSTSMPGLTDISATDNKSKKGSEAKSKPFFQIFRKKVANDRSPSPAPKSNPNRRRSSNPCDVPHAHSLVNRQLSNHSATSSRQLQMSFPSTVPCTPTSHRSIKSPAISSSTSPSSGDKLPQHMSKKKSRSKRRKETRSNTLTPEQFALPEDHLTLDDLPTHPSIVQYNKKYGEKTNSYPNTPVLRKKSAPINTKSNQRSKNCTGIRRNSTPESSDDAKDESECSDADKGMKESSDALKQNLRRKSLGEMSGKTSSDEIFQCEIKTSRASQKTRTDSRCVSMSSCGGTDLYLPDTDIRVISDAEDFEYNPTDMTGPINLSLCGCGFLGMYHLGVVSCLAQRAPSFIDQMESVGGASAGAIMAAVLVTCSDKIEESAEHLQNLAREIRKKPLGPLTPGYNFTRSLRYMLDNILPQDAHETSRNKLFVSVTNVDNKKNEMLSNFTSRDELIEALVASCYVPVYAGIKIPTVRGKKYADVGISSNIPKFDRGRTITVSPFDGKSDIGPKTEQEAEKRAHFINVQNQDVQLSVSNVKKSVYAFFPPKRQTLQDLFEKGRYDASRFLIREGLYEILAQPPKKAVLYESSV